MKSSFYFKHDLDARGDDKMRALLMKKGATGYGIYWMVVEDLYKNDGRLVRDYTALAWDYRQPEKEIKAVIEDFGMFYDASGKIACRRVDKDRAERAEALEAKRRGGKTRAAQLQLSSSSGAAQVGQEGEEGKDITTARTPSAVDKLISGIDKGIPKDFHAYRFPKGFNATYAGAYLMNVPVDECVKLLNTPRLGDEIKEALEWRIAEKKLETARGK